jgi:S-adenosylmethionine:tRNA ribosyltransferase-isomerase
MLTPIKNSTLTRANSTTFDGTPRFDAPYRAAPRLDGLAFDLPPELEAHEPPEARGLRRDEVRLLVSYRSTDRIVHDRFHRIGEFLRAGDVVVINTSGTLPAALNAARSDGSPIELHLSTQLPADIWIVELRRPGEKGTQPFYQATRDEMLQLPEGATATLFAPYALDRQTASHGGARLWLAALQVPGPLPGYLQRNGFPIRYSYVPHAWPIDYYQTVYATEMGSAEMPSAGRPFTPELITQLVARGVQFAPLLLHAGVASLESHEPPYEEYYRVSPETAQAVNAARTLDKRIIAVGTTVVRALETVTDEENITHPGEGWTRLVITPERGIRSVNALLTGWHEPRATHLAMLETLAGREHLQIAYREALRERYLWHEFGDVHLILP